ncbi:MAG: hypothetical protein QUS13_13175, partial [Smithella sp.]|nr:hypothetical protein [Smithella sp.]
RRHTRYTALSRGLGYVYKRQGHAAVTTTETYTHVMTDNLRDASGPIIRQIKTATRKRVNVKT